MFDFSFTPIAMFEDPLHKKWSFPLSISFGKCEQIRRKLRIYSHYLKKSVTENFIFCAVIAMKAHEMSLVFFMSLENDQKKVASTCWSYGKSILEESSFTNLFRTDFFPLFWSYQILGNIDVKMVLVRSRLRSCFHL